MGREDPRAKGSDVRTKTKNGSPELAGDAGPPLCGQLELSGQLARAEAERDALAEREAELLRALAAREEQLNALATRVQFLESREEDLRALLLAAHEQLMDGAAATSESAPAGGEDACCAAALPGGNGRVDGHASRWSGLAGYRQVVEQVRRTVGRAALPGSTVLVVSRGDEDLVKLDGLVGWHFPRAESGVYAGHYPADSAAAIDHLEALRARGARYLVFPLTAMWWLEHYAELAQYLAARYMRVGGNDDACVVYKLFRSPREAQVPAAADGRG